MQRQLDDWIDAYLDYTSNSEPPEMFHLWTAVSCIAACLKRKCWLEWGMLTHYPNMYIVLVAPSGRARKGTAMDIGYNFLTELNIRLSAEATTRESLIRYLKQSSDTHIDQETGRQSLHSSLTIWSQELTVFLGYNNSQLMSDLTDWYDCKKRWHYSTKDRSLSDDLVNIWVNLYGATTPPLIQTALPQDAIGGGLTSRVIFVFEENKRCTVAVPELSDKQMALHPKLLHDLEMIHLLSGQFVYDSKFRDAYCEWYEKEDKNPPFKDGRLAGYNERRANHLKKLCIIMSASRSQSKVLTLVDFIRAKTILEETEKNMPKVFGGVGKSQIAPIINKIIYMLVQQERIAYEDLATHFWNDVDIAGLDKAIQAIEAMKVGRLVISQKGQKYLELVEAQK